MELTTPIWILVAVAGLTLGIGITSFAGWPVLLAPLIGGGLLLLTLVVYDRRRYRRGTVNVLLALDRPTVDRILTDARAAGIEAGLGVAPKTPVRVPDGQIAVRCRRSKLGEFLAVVDRHDPDRSP
jgi:hypothetical protein